jgi:hypothetical protein
VYLNGMFDTEIWLLRNGKGFCCREVSPIVIIVGSSVLWRHILGIFSQIFSRSTTTTTTQTKQKKSRVIFERSVQNSIAKFFVLFHVENNITFWQLIMIRWLGHGQINCFFFYHVFNGPQDLLTNGSDIQSTFLPKKFFASLLPQFEGTKSHGYLIGPLVQARGSNWGNPPKF